MARVLTPGRSLARMGPWTERSVAPATFAAGLAREIGGTRSELGGTDAFTGQTADQIAAWNLYYSLPEVRRTVVDAATMIGQSIFYAGYLDGNGNERRLSVEGDTSDAEAAGFTPEFIGAVETEWGRFRDRNGRQAGLVHPAAIGFQVCGDGWVVGWPIDADGAPATSDEATVSERWEVVSGAALRKRSKDTWEIDLSTSARSASGGGWTILPRDRTVVRRLVNRSPQRPEEAAGWVIDSRRVLLVAAKIDAAIAATVQSTIPADVLIVPAEANLGSAPRPLDPATSARPKQGGVKTEGRGVETLTLSAQIDELLAEVVTAALADTQSGATVIPSIVTMTQEHIDKIRPLSLSRQVDAEIPKLLQAFIDRIGTFADTAPENLKGLGETNRWNGVEISKTEFRRYLRPLSTSIGDAFTSSLLRPALYAHKWTGEVPADLIRRVFVLVDPTPVVRPPDTSKFASDALRFGAIGFGAYRAAVGFTEDDAPSEEERAMIYEYVTRASRVGNSSTTGTVNQEVGSAAPSGPSTPAPDRAPLSDFPTPTTATFTASDQDPDALALDLLGIELSARERVQEAAAVAYASALRRSGNKLRSAAQRDQVLRVELARLDPVRIPEVLGPERSAALVSVADVAARIEDYFGDAVDAVTASFRRVAQDVFRRLSGKGVTVDEAVQAANIELGTESLRESFGAWLDDVVFGDGGAIPDEPPTTSAAAVAIPLPIIRRAFVAAGGGAVDGGWRIGFDLAGSMVFGPDVMPLLPEYSGRKWLRGPGHRQQPFPGHVPLDGVFLPLGLDDPLLDGHGPGGSRAFPADHWRCQCNTIPSNGGNQS